MRHLFQREVRLGFDGGSISTDGGGLLLGKVEKRTGGHCRLARCFQDGRNPDLIEHTVAQLVRQGIYGWPWGMKI